MDWSGPPLLTLVARRPAPPRPAPGLIRPDWRAQFPCDSVVVESVVSIVVRKGNPKNIRGWEDLVR